MIQCPKCNQGLPDWSQHCQFCGADVKAVQRPVAAPKKQYAAFQVPQWVWTMYYVIAGWWLIGGIFQLLNGIFAFGAPPDEAEMNILMVIGGGISALMGLGLILKIEIIRGIVNFFSGLKLLFGIISLLGALASMSLFGVFGLPFVLMSIIDIVTAAMMIYLIGETDKQARL